MSAYNNVIGISKVLEAMESSLRVMCEAHLEYIKHRGASFKDLYMDDDSHCTLTVNGGDWIFRIFRHDQIIAKIAFGAARVKSKVLRVYPNMIYSNGLADAKVVVIDPISADEFTFDLPLKEDMYFQKSLVVELPDSDAVISIATILSALELESTSSFTAQVYEPNFEYNLTHELNVACVAMIQAMVNDLTPESP